ncbi:HPr kinase/phosphorylase [Clostridium sp. 19966]|uniref:HPr(Ser) kinase/phosphatase n=1 Tax=Clostridium sp. 19966 TaxID=2768166 RepID=UPI0028DF2595|nr:HPr(Ser) kinase/phosphatase [Clostridium sp. 19966]MDT8715221.1 HPr kinase/phosphorylase [Clostridium sp. 19966]
MSVLIQNLIEDLNLEMLNEGNKDNIIDVSDFNRPGLQFTGFYNYFANERIQVIGMAEWSFLEGMQPELRKKRLNKFFSFETPCVIITRGLNPQPEITHYAAKYDRWFLRTNMSSTKFISRLTNYLSDKLAPETRLHGVLVDVYGIGILITGESGIGKSETALELIKRGHRLVADDAVDIKNIDGMLAGRSPFITGGMMEVRGMGIIDVPALYGLSSILYKKNIDFIISLEQWKSDENYDRLGIDNQTMDILGVPVKKIVVPIRPGRNVAVIIEAAAVNYRYNLMSRESPVDTINKRMEMQTKNDQSWG